MLAPITVAKVSGSYTDKAVRGEDAPDRDDPSMAAALRNRRPANTNPVSMGTQGSEARRSWKSREGPAMAKGGLACPHSAVIP